MYNTLYETLIKKQYKFICIRIQKDDFIETSKN